MTYEEALQYIWSYGWRGSIRGLSRMRTLLDRLGNPERATKYLHIAGTNGKGSTASMSASILACAGYRTGLYTSPFVNVFNERIRFNGENIPDADVARLTEQIRDVADTMDDHPTVFEMTTALGFLYFAEKRCDIVVLEVGMGGELDATNVIETSEASVITAMGLDHVEELGPTMTDIAYAKAGILREGVPVVSYGGNKEADCEIARIAALRHAPLISPDFTKIVPLTASLDGQTFSYKEREDIALSLIGTYQLNNAAVVLEAMDVLRSRGWDIPEDAIREGLRTTWWPARFEVLRRKPTVIVDGGHNPHGITATAGSIRRLFPDRKIVFVTGVMADKDVETMMSLLTPMAKRFYTVRPENPRAMAPELLAERISALGVPAEPKPSVGEALDAAMEAAGRDGVVIAVGSLYLSGAVRAYIGGQDIKRAGAEVSYG